MSSPRHSHFITFPWVQVDGPIKRVLSPSVPPMDRLHSRVFLAFKCMANLLNYGPQLYLIMAFNSISKLGQSKPPCSSLSDSIIAFKFARQRPPVSPHHVLYNSFWVHSLLTRFWPSSASSNSLDHCCDICKIMAFKCITELAWLQPPSASGSSEHDMHTIAVSKSACEFTCSSSPGTAWIVPKHHLHPVQIYGL